MNGDTVESLYEALHSTKAKNVITTTAVSSLLATLESQDGELCSLNIQTFCAILHIVLKGKDCPEGERILVLFANELYQQSLLSQDTESSESVLVNIAKEVDVGHLIEYFVDSSRPNVIRIWVGIIMQQLLRGPEAVFEQFQHTPEDIRRSIGPSVISEGNEIVRLICGQLLKALLNSDILPEELWPVGTNKKDYETFPTESQSQSGWKSLFQKWVDGRWPDNPSQAPPQLLYFSHGVVTTPPFRLGAAGENIEFVLEGGYILMLTTSTENELDQILQVPCSSVNRISVSDTSSIINGKAVYNIIIDVKEGSEVSCYLNSKLKSVQQLCLTMTSYIGELMEDLRSQCLEAEFPEERFQVSQAEEDILVQGKGSSPESQSRDRPSEENEHQDLVSHSVFSEDEEVNTAFNLESETQTEFPRGQTDNNKSSLADGELEKSQQNPHNTNVTNKGNVSDSVPNTKPGASQTKLSQSSRDTDLNANKLPKNYLLKPKPPIAASKGKVESTRTTLPTKTNTISKDKEGTAQSTAPGKPTSIYDLPANEDDQTKVKKTIHNTKGVKNKVGGSQQKGKTSGKDRVKNAKTYQKPKPTPMEVEEPIPAKRSSQRVAASQAKVSMSKINDDPENIEDDLSDERDSGPAQSNVSRKRKTVEQPADPAVPEAKLNHSFELDSEKDEEAFDLQQQDAQELGLIDSNLPLEDPFQVDDDLYSASPQASKGRTNYSQDKPQGPSRKTAAVNFANQLDGLLSDDLNGDNKTTHTNTLRKGLFKKRPLPSAPPPKLGELTQSMSKKKSAVTEKKISGELVQGAEDDNSHHSQYEDAQGLQLDKCNPAKPDYQQTEEVLPVISCEMEVKENQTVGKTNGAKEVSDTKLFVFAVEKENESLIVATQGDPVLEIPSHPLSRFSKISKQEVVHKPVTAKAIDSNVHQSNLESSPPILPPPDTILVEEKKRKVATEIALPSKRRRSIASKSSDNLPISRPDPRPQIKTSLESSTSKSKTLLDDRSIRKPNLIHFGSKGALNQGFSSTSKPVPERDPELPITTPNMAKEQPHHNKRRHVDQDEESLFISQSPPRKRQSISPPDLAASTIAPVLTEDNSAPMALVLSNLKSSSQGSRVDAFGSPLAQNTIPSIGQILKFQQRGPAPEFGQLAPRTLDFQQDVPSITVKSPEYDAKDTPDIFGPRIKVVSIAKARPAPPGESPIRYVPHTKTQHGTYEGILTMENIQEENVLPDPFVEDVHRQSSGFTERLRARQTNSQSKTDGSLNVPFSDPDKTLVEIEEQHTTRELSSEHHDTRELSSPSELTTNSSFRSDDSSNTPTQELSPHSQWSLAVRPHYRGYADTVHKIADEMVIRLANEEDASSLIVRQYNDNATTMLEGLTSERDKEKLSIREQIENKKKELIRMYSEANKVMAQTEKDLKTAPMGDLNREWQKRQDAILREMKG
ncbi:hypothetical protein NHQ30_007373 [Ciborinia camelliae]|nr:hypothetical protein NHQ30_007373 [Ciborinia camelliae]